MAIPFYNPTRRSLLFSLVLLLAWLLLVLTGLGVFRLYFDFDWAGESDAPGQLFSLRIKGGNAFNLFDNPGFGPTFWISQTLSLLLALALPWFRLWGGSILAALTAVVIVVLHSRQGVAEPLIPLEFELLIVIVLYLIYLLMQYYVEIGDRKHFATLLSQYVPPELARVYSRHPERLGLAGEEREVSVLFCDVIGFSSISESLPPEKLVEWLNGFLAHVSRIVVRHRGTIDKFMGDSVMAVWGAPARSDSHAFDCLSAALDIQSELGELNQRFLDAGLPLISVGVGVSTGPAHVGALGSEYRMDYTVVGDPVNVAQRLEAQTRKYKVPIVVGGRTAEALPDHLFRELDTIQVKGRSSVVTMYQPLGAARLADDELKRNLASHERAMRASKAGDWNEAEQVFRELRNQWGPEGMYELYLRGIEAARRH